MTKQMKIILAALGVGIVLIVAGFLFLRRGNNTEETTPPASPPVQVAQNPTPPVGKGQTAGGPGAKKQGPQGQKKAGAPPSSARPAGPGVSAPGAKQGIFAGSPPKAAAAAKPAVQTAKTGIVPIRHRSDPFLIGWRRQPLPPPVFALVSPMRIASADIVAPPPNNTIITEVPSRRVSGILTGDGVYAVLEDNNGDTEIVKPGSITSDGYRVVAINSDSVKLQRRDGNLLRTQTVPLSDATTAPVIVRPAGFSGAPGFGQPGAGGGGKFGGGLGRPGMGGGMPGVGGAGGGGGAASE